MSFTNRYRRHLVEKINALSDTEHEEIFKIMRYNGIEFTQNKNGIFFNISTVDHAVIEQISNFVSFSSENKKNLDEYDKKINECKMNNNYDDILQKHQDEERLPCETFDDSEKKDDWAAVLAQSQNKEKLEAYIADLWDANSKCQKRKCSSKYNIAKKKYARRVFSDKKFDIEDTVLIEEDYKI